MALLTNQSIVRTGLEATYAAASAGGDTIDGTGERVFLHVINGGGGDVTVTVETPNTVDGLAVADLDVVVTAGEERMIGPFPLALYGQNNAGESLNDGQAVEVTYSGVASVTVAAIKLPVSAY